MKKNLFFILFVILFSAITPMPILAISHNVHQSWHVWLSQFRHEAIADGINHALFDRVFRNITPSKRHIQLDRTQPEKRLTFLKYRNTRCDQYRITLGRREYRRYQSLLKSIGQKYGVSPCVITALWGMESSYGRFMGNFSTIRSLATLAYDGRRSAFFRRELLYALHMLQDGHVTLANFKGEWAGATGQTQFLPSSWHHYAIDYNLDGRKDIWKTHGDIFASIANYLKQHGWIHDQPWGFIVKLPHNFDQTLIGKEHKKTLQEWLLLGVSPTQPINHLPHHNWKASIIKPYGGPYLLVFKNFNVLMRWNRSTYYAGTVGYLADHICS